MEDWMTWNAYFSTEKTFMTFMETKTNYGSHVFMEDTVSYTVMPVGQH